LAPAAHDGQSAFLAMRGAGAVAARHTVLITLLPPPDAAAWADRSQDDVPGIDTAPTTLPGTIVGPSRILTHGLAFADQALRTGARVTDAAGATFAARIERCDPSSGLVVLSVAGEGLEPAPAVGIPVPWTTAVAVMRAGMKPVLGPVWIAGVEGATVRLGFGRPAPGTGLFDDDSDLVAIAAGDGQAWAAGAALERVGGLPVALPVRLGLTMQAITEDLRPLVSAAGVLVADVVPEGPAARAGIVPGDVLTHVAASPVAQPRDVMVALAALSHGAETAVRVQRGGKERQHAARVEAVCSPRERAATTSGRRAEEIFTAEALQAAGLHGRALVLDVNGARPVARRRARASRPVLVRARLDARPAAFYAVTP
jgi:hypothetical protein